MGRNWTLVLAAGLCLAGCTKQDKPVSDVKALMVEHVQVSAEVYWNAVQYISDKDGAREIVPKNEEEWNRTIAAATQLKALGNRMKQPEYAAGRGTDWNDFAQGMVDVSAVAERAARSHDPAKVLDAGGTIYNVCSACHEVYMPSPAGLAPTSPAPAQPAG